MIRDANDDASTRIPEATISSLQLCEGPHRYLAKRISSTGACFRRAGQLLLPTNDDCKPFVAQACSTPGTFYDRHQARVEGL